MFAETVRYMVGGLALFLWVCWHIFTFHFVFTFIWLSFQNVGLRREDVQWGAADILRRMWWTYADIWRKIRG